MKLKTTDNEKISRKKCMGKGCKNKASGIINQKFYCKECYDRISPKNYERRGRPPYEWIIGEN